MTTILAILLLASPLLIVIIGNIIRVRQYNTMRKYNNEEFKRKVAKNIAQMFTDYADDYLYGTEDSDIERYFYDHFNEIFKD